LNVGKQDIIKHQRVLQIAINSAYLGIRSLYPVELVLKLMFCLY